MVGVAALVIGAMGATGTAACAGTGALNAKHAAATAAQTIDRIINTLLFNSNSERQCMGRV